MHGANGVGGVSSQLAREGKGLLSRFVLDLKSLDGAAGDLV